MKIIALNDESLLPSLILKYFNQKHKQTNNQTIKQVINPKGNVLQLFTNLRGSPDELAPCGKGPIDLVSVRL